MPLPADCPGFVAGTACCRAGFKYFTSADRLKNIYEYICHAARYETARITIPN